MSDDLRKIVVELKDFGVRFEIDPATLESTVIGEIRPEDREAVADALASALKQFASALKQFEAEAGGEGVDDGPITAEDVLDEATRLGAEVEEDGIMFPLFMIRAPRDHWWPAIRHWEFAFRLGHPVRPMTPEEIQEEVDTAWAALSGHLGPWKWPSLENLVLSVEHLGGSAEHVVYRDEGRDFWLFHAPKGCRWVATGERDLELHLKGNEDFVIDDPKKFQHELNDLAIEVERGIRPRRRRR